VSTLWHCTEPRYSQVKNNPLLYLTSPLLTDTEGKAVSDNISSTYWNSCYSWIVLRFGARTEWLIFGDHGAKQVVLVYGSICHRYISQWIAKMCWKSRAQTALIQRKLQFPDVFEHHLRRSPCVLCLQDFVANIWTCQRFHHSSNMHINPLKTKGRPLYLKTQYLPRYKHFSSQL